MIHVKLIIMALIWAGGCIASKVVSAQAGPFTIAFLRFCAATLVLLALVNRRKSYVRINFRLFATALAAAFFGILCYNAFFLLGIKQIDAGRGSVIVSTIPIAVIVISYLIFKEKLSVVNFCGVVFSLLGAWVVITHGNILDFVSSQIGWGEIYMILAVISAAVFALFSKQLLKTLTPLLTMTYISALGTVLLCIPALVEMSHTTGQVYSQSFILNLLYLAVGPSVIASVFYHEGITVVGVSKASQYMNLIPVFAVLFAVVFLGEQITRSLVLGGGLVTTGLYLTNFR